MQLLPWNLTNCFRRSAWLGLIYALNIDHFWCVNSISSAHSLFGNRSLFERSQKMQGSWGNCARATENPAANRAAELKSLLPRHDGFLSLPNRSSYYAESNSEYQAGAAGCRARCRAGCTSYYRSESQIFRVIFSEFDLDSSLTSYPESAAAFRLSVVKKAQKAARAWWILMNFDQFFKNWRIYSSNLWKFIKKKKNHHNAKSSQKWWNLMNLMNVHQIFGDEPSVHHQMMNWWIWWTDWWWIKLLFICDE